MQFQKRETLKRACIFIPLEDHLRSALRGFVRLAPRPILQLVQVFEGFFFHSTPGIQRKSPASGTNSEIAVKLV